MARYILGLDQGTTRTKVMVFDHKANIISSGSKEVGHYLPQPGWVEQDPNELWNASQQVIGEAFHNGRVSPDEIEAIGIANQTATTMFWNKYTGEPVGRAIVWQDRRTISLYEQLAATCAEEIKTRTGLEFSPNCSALRIRWLTENDNTIQKGLARGELLYGTIESWLIWKLSAGSVHVTDLSNASVTLLVNAHTLNYDNWILQKLAIPREILPQIRSSSEIYAYTHPESFFGVHVPIAGALVDHSSSVISCGCLQSGTAKITFGTGSSIVLNTGDQRIQSIEKVSAPVIWAAGGDAVYGLVGWTDVSGSAIQWLRDGLGIITELREAEGLASQVPDTEGVYFVPAFYGLGAPYYDPYSRGTIFGITSSTTRHHIARAALEAMAYQVRGSFDVMQRISGMEIKKICVDGISVQGEFLAQFLSDILGIAVDKPANTENGVLGAAFLAGLATGYWESINEVATYIPKARRFEPRISPEERGELYQGWLKAVKRTEGWLKR
jgi:glycerol kinase